jgi:hypothetical protein
MSYLLNEAELGNQLVQVEKDFLGCEKIKFQRLNKWRKEFVPDFPGVYALYEKVGDKYILIYVGESGNLRERMSDICRTVNHTFRRQLGHQRFSAIKTNKKFEKETEALLDIFFDESLYISFLKVNFGRTEIESYLVTKYQNTLLNSETKRKLKIELANL